MLYSPRKRLGEYTMCGVERDQFGLAVGMEVFAKVKKRGIDCLITSALILCLNKVGGITGIAKGVVIDQ